MALFLLGASMGRAAQIAELKTEIQQFAWTQDPEERSHLNFLKRRMYSLQTGDPGSWSAERGEWSWEPNSDLACDLHQYHFLADRLSGEDGFD